MGTVSVDNNQIPPDLEKEILSILDKSDLGRERSHAENTLFWVKKIKPEASLALQIAALAHDIERGFLPRYKSEDFGSRQEYKKAHSEKGANILEEILQKYKIDEKIINEATELVRLHEIGGSKDADVLMDADSISFFDNNLDFYISYKGLDEAIRQVKYKYERCTQRAKEYINKLENYLEFQRRLLKKE